MVGLVGALHLEGLRNDQVAADGSHTRGVTGGGDRGATGWLVHPGLPLVEGGGRRAVHVGVRVHRAPVWPRVGHRGRPVDGTCKDTNNIEGLIKYKLFSSLYNNLETCIGVVQRVRNLYGRSAIDWSGL